MSIRDIGIRENGIRENGCFGKRSYSGYWHSGSWTSGNVIFGKLAFGQLSAKVVPDTPPDYYKLYTNCWNEDPEKRPMVEDVYDKLTCMLPKNNENIEDIFKAEDTGGNFL